MNNKNKATLINLINIILLSSLKAGLENLITPETLTLPALSNPEKKQIFDDPLRSRNEFVSLAKCLLSPSEQTKVRELIESDCINNLYGALIDLIRKLVPTYFNYKRCKLDDKIALISQFRRHITEFRQAIEPKSDFVGIADIEREYFVRLAQIESTLTIVAASKNFIAQVEIGFSIFQLFGFIRPLYIPREIFTIHCHQTYFIVYAY